MNTMDEPRRLFEHNDAPAGLRDLLERAHADVPPEAMVQALVRAAEQGAQTSAPIARIAERVSWGARHAGQIVLVAALAGAGAWFVASGKRAGIPDAPNTSPPESTGWRNTGTPSLDPAGTDPIATVESPVEVLPPDLAKAPPRPRPLAEKAPRTTPAPLPGTKTTIAAGTSLDTAGADEYLLLRAARQALTGEPGRALALTDEHVRRFAHGRLEQERETIAVEALAQLGRTAQAQSRGRLFLSTYPGSPYRNRVEHAIRHPSGSAIKP